MKNIAVIYGGNSCEKDISVITAMQAMAALDKNKYKVFPVFWNNGFCIPEDSANIKVYARSDGSVIGKDATFVGDNLYVIKRSKLKLLAKIDCALLCTHGGLGENGALQGFLDVQGIPYTSSGVLASGIGMDKSMCKLVCKKLSLPILPYGALCEGESNEIVDKILERIGFPVIVKPANQGSSIGINVCKTLEELETALKTAFYYDKKVVLEKALTDFKEINCACLRKNGKLYPSTLEEPIGWREFLTFEDKYMSGGKITKSSAKRIFPAQMSDTDEKKIKNMTAKLYSALGCKGIVRCDFLIDKESGEIYLNEINTIPGSMAGYLYEDRGIGLNAILDVIIEESIKEFKERKICGYSSKVLQYYANNNTNACKVSLKNV